MTNSKTDFARLDRLADADIEAAAAADPDNPLLTDQQLASLEVVIPTPKRAISIRLDDNVIAWFKAQGPGYQTRISAVLKAYVLAQQQSPARAAEVYVMSDSGATRIAEELQASAHRQAEILRATFEGAGRSMRDLMEHSSEHRMVRETELAKAAFESAIANMRELAEMVTKANAETFEVINRRVAESLDVFKQMIDEPTGRGGSSVRADVRQRGQC